MERLNQGVMMRSIFLFISASFLIFSIQAFDVDDLFGGGERDFELRRFTNGDILLQIERDAEIACKKTLCTIYGVTNDYRRFEVSFDIGQGSSGGGGGFSFPGSDGGSGSSGSSSSALNWSLKVRFVMGRCTQSVNVDRTLYFVIKRYLYNLVTEEGRPGVTLTPADNAILNLMNTIVTSATGCSIT